MKINKLLESKKLKEGWYEDHLDTMQRKTSGYDKCYKIVKKARTSNPIDTNALNDARDHFGYDLYRMCLSDVLKEIGEPSPIPESFKPSDSGIQSVKCYNQYNYTIQELRVDNDNKTFERGQFTAGKPDKKTKNRQEFEDIVDTLKELGYTEIKSDYQSMRNKSRKGVLQEADNGKVSASKWYASQYPDDKVGIEQLDGLYLDDILKDRKLVGHCDTQVRDRVYAQLDRYSPRILDVKELDDGKKWQYSIGGVDVPYTSYEDAKAHMKDDYKITDYRDELQKYIDKETGRPQTFFVDETFDDRLVISINWGDWKHEHGYADYLVKKFFMDKGLGIEVEEEITDEDGSDTYSADHYYDINDVSFSGRVVSESKSTNESEGNHFKVGDTFTHSGLYGGTYDSTVKSIDGNKLNVETTWTSEDDGSTQKDDGTYELTTDGNGKECIVVWEYNGEKGYVYPESHNGKDEIEEPLSEAVIDDKALKEIKWIIDGILDCEPEKGLDADGLKFLHSRARYMKKVLDSDNGLEESLSGYKLNITKGAETFDDYCYDYSEDGAKRQMNNKYGKDITINSIEVHNKEMNEASANNSEKLNCKEFDDKKEAERFAKENNGYYEPTIDDNQKTTYNVFYKENDNLQEASYGGAFDIEDDQYFTRDDLNDFAEEVLNHINETFKTPFDVSSCYIDNGILELCVTNDEYGDYIYSEKIDMRKIKEPWHLKRAYAFEFASQLINDITRSNDGLIESVVSSSYEFDDDIDELTYYYDDEELKDALTDIYEEIASKQVMDSDGFMTDYTMYRNINTGEYVFVFGDKDIYRPEDGYFDWECETEDEAKEWFDNYEGFDYDDDDWMNEEVEEQSPIIHKKGDGSYLIASPDGGYTAFNRSDVCMGHISAENETEAKNKFNSNKFDENLSK